jgi:hypothetical protein
MAKSAQKLKPHKSKNPNMIEVIGDRSASEERSK